MMQVISPAPREAWRGIIADDPQALPEHAPEWVDALCAVAPYRDASRLYCLPDGRRFVLPLVRRTGVTAIGGTAMSYPPSWGMGGLIGDGADPEVVRAVLNDLRETRSQRISIRPDPRRFSHWAEAVDESMTLIKRRAHVIDLTGGPDAVMKRWNRSARRGVRVAERSGVRIEVDRSGELLDQYYQLYLRSVDRWAKRQHEPRALAHWRAARRDPLIKLQRISDFLDKAFIITMAYVQDQPAYASITLLGQTAHDTRSAMDLERVGSTGAGELVQWTTLRLACDYGCTAYHLGESGESKSLAYSKEKFGAEPIEYAEIRVERLPYTRVDQSLRSLAKRTLRFRDV